MPTSRRMKLDLDYDYHEIQNASRGPYAGRPKRAPVDISRHLTEAQLRDMREGYFYAVSRGLDPNTFLTINLVSFRGKCPWNSASKTEEEVLVLVARLREKIVQLLLAFTTELGIPNIYVYAWENPPEGGPGVHVHFLLHLPTEHPRFSYQELRSRLGERLGHAMGWTSREIQTLLTAKRLAAPDRKDHIRLPFYFTDSESEAGPDQPLTREQQETRLDYICKGASPDQIIEHDGKRRSLLQQKQRSGCLTLSRQGDPHTRRRGGCSRSINRSARKAVTATPAAEALAEVSRLELLDRSVKSKARRALVQAILVAFEQRRLDAANDDVPVSTTLPLPTVENDRDIDLEGLLATLEQIAPEGDKEPERRPAP